MRIFVGGIESIFAHVTLSLNGLENVLKRGSSVGLLESLFGEPD